LAASKTKSHAPRRVSFAKIREPLEVPNLLSLQLESIDWLLGNEAWRARLTDAEKSHRGEVPKQSGLEEIFEEISPIEDFQGSMSLSFRDHRFEPPKYTIAECKERDITYAAPLFLTAEFTNNITGEIKSQTVFMGDFPLMTPRGTFVINGTERVVVSQIVRSPGVYFERTIEKTSDKDIFTTKIIPSRGAWLEFEVDKKDMVGVRIDRKRKQSVTVFLKALGWSSAQILEQFGEFESIKLTLEKDNVETQDEALLDIYRKLRPGEPPTKEAAQNLIENLYFNPKRYDLAKVGRFKINKKLGLELDLSRGLLTIEDIVGTIKYLVALHRGDALMEYGKEVRVETDDIDHFGNRRLRTVGELIQNQVRTGLSRMERVVRERMTTQDVEAITPQTLINIRPVVASIKEFFGTSQLSQFMDQTNPLSGMTHKRRLSALGPGGLSRERAGFDLATYARVTPFGFIETPYRKVVDGKVSDRIDYLTADEEDEHIIAQANAPLTEDNHFAEPRVLVRRRGGEVENIQASEVDYMDVSPRQMVSVATAMIPFLDDVLLARKSGVVTEVNSDQVLVKNDDGSTETYFVEKFVRSNQGTSRNQKVVVSAGDKIEAGAVVADGASTEMGEMALGKNLLVAFMSWEGHNYEDAIILSQRLVQDDVLTSIHIEEYEVDARDTKLGAEEITRDIPNVSEEVLADLDERGIIRVGADVVPGDILVGKVTPKGETELTPEERLLRAIFGEKAREVRDTSLKVPHGESGKVIGVSIQDSEEGFELAAGVNQVVRVYVAQKRKIQDGDKLAGRHGNKGVISKILPVEDMPFLEDGTPVDVVLNPLGVPGRMNVGQVLETHLGWVAKSGWKLEGNEDWQKSLRANGYAEAPANTKVATPVFDGTKEEELSGLLGSTLPNKDGMRLIGADGKAQLFDGRTGEPYKQPISVGYMYILKLHHLVDDKIHARSTGPYSMITQQPLGGKAQFGGQRFGEMEVWALEAYGAAYTLQELLTIKSDDVLGRVKVYEAIVKGENIPEPGIPESFKVLVKEMQSLCLNVEVLSSEGVAIEMRDTDEEVFRTAEELGINLSRVEPSSVEEV